MATYHKPSSESEKKVAFEEDFIMDIYEEVKRDLARALVRFSYGRIGIEEADAKAAVAAKYYLESDNEALRHKGINWYAKQMIGAMK